MKQYYFEENGKVYLIKCPKCNRENYAIAVPTGQCCWCAYKCEEKWYDIKGFENYYQISTFGNVKSKKRIIHNKSTFNNNYTVKEKILKNRKSKQGYLYVALCKGGKQKQKSVHRLIAENILNILEGYQVNHKDGNKENNHIFNLECVTPSENTKHAYDNNLASVKNRKRNKFGRFCK